MNRDQKSQDKPPERKLKVGEHHWSATHRLDYYFHGVRLKLHVKYITSHRNGYYIRVCKVQLSPQARRKYGVEFLYLIPYSKLHKIQKNDKIVDER